MPREESNITPETEPLLLPKNSLSHPADILCSPPSLPETLNEERLHRDSDLCINNQTTMTNDIC